eukprot:1157859-Pelagomonas_calceolata.AAC.1
MTQSKVGNKEGVVQRAHGQRLIFDPRNSSSKSRMHVALRRAVRIKAEASSSMHLLRSMLPNHVIKKLKAGQTYIAQRHEQPQSQKGLSAAKQQAFFNCSEHRCLPTGCFQPWVLC